MNAFATLISPVPAGTIRPSLFVQRRAAAQPATASSGPALPLSRGSDAVGTAALFYLDDKPLPPPASQGDATGLVAGLRGAPDHSARKALMKEQLRSIGFEWMGYGTFEDRQGVLRPLSVLVSYAHEAWIRSYFSQRHHEVDTRANDAPVSGLPLVWDLESLAQSQCRQPLQAETGTLDTAARRRMLLDEMEASGIRSGISFRLATPGHMHEHTFIDLMSGTPGRGWILGATVGRALMLGLSVHEHVSRHVRKPVAAMRGQEEPMHAKSPISPTQQSILESLLRGLGDKEIAYTLGLSSHAVDYHMRQLRRRFGVRNRVQLVSAAADWQP